MTSDIPSLFLSLFLKNPEPKPSKWENILPWIASASVQTPAHQSNPRSTEARTNPPAFSSVPTTPRHNTYVYSYIFIDIHIHIHILSLFVLHIRILPICIVPICILTHLYANPTHIVLILYLAPDFPIYPTWYDLTWYCEFCFRILALSSHSVLPSFRPSVDNGDIPPYLHYMTF